MSLLPPFFFEPTASQLGKDLHFFWGVWRGVDMDVGCGTEDLGFGGRGARGALGLATTGEAALLLIL